MYYIYIYMYVYMHLYVYDSDFLYIIKEEDKLNIY